MHAPEHYIIKGTRDVLQIKVLEVGHPIRVPWQMLMVAACRRAVLSMGGLPAICVLLQIEFWNWVMNCLFRVDQTDPCHWGMLLWSCCRRRATAMASDSGQDLDHSQTFFAIFWIGGYQMRHGNDISRGTGFVKESGEVKRTGREAVARWSFHFEVLFQRSSGNMWRLDCYQLLTKCLCFLMRCK